MISSKRSKTPTKKKARASSYCSLHFDNLRYVFHVLDQMESGIEVPKQGGQDEKDWQVTQVVTKQHNGACLQRPRIEPTMSPFQKRRGSQPAISPEMPSRSPMVCRVLPKCRTPREKRATSMATRGLGNCSWQAVKPVVLGISILFTQLSMDWFKENSTGNPGPTLSTKNQLCASNVQWGAPAIAGSPFAEADQKWEMYGMW